MQRNCQLIRVLNILYDFLKSHSPKTVAMLSAEHKVHTKTIRRDLKAIELSKFKLKKMNKDHRAEYSLENKFINI